MNKPSSACPVCGKDKGPRALSTKAMISAGEHILGVVADLTISACLRNREHLEGAALIGDGPEDAHHGHVLAFVIDDTPHVVCTDCILEACKNITTAYSEGQI